MTVMGKVLRIERSSNKDGAGLRTVVFLKGCPLRCEWCSTPESQSASYEVGFLPSLCIKCGECAKACLHGLIHFDAVDGVSAEPLGCAGCGRCKTACTRSAVRIYGREMSSDELMEEIVKDDVFFHHGGGVTLSGGEVLSQPDFVMDILKRCHGFGIDAAMESCAFAKWGVLAPMLDYLSSIFIDVKIMDPVKHESYTGAGNALVLDNIVRIDSSDKTKLTIRVPFIPTVNDDVENFEMLAYFCSGLRNLLAIEILPYHRLGLETYRNLGRPVPFPEIFPPRREEIEDKIVPLKRLKNAVVRIG